MLTIQNILDGAQTNGNGEINTANYSRNCILILYKIKGLQDQELCITIIECKIDLSSLFDISDQYARAQFKRANCS